MKPIIVTLASVILLAGCSASYQAGQQTRSDDKEVTQPYGATTAARNITTVKGYQPTDDDVSRYKNNVKDFLEANVPNFSRFSKAMIVIDDVQADDLSEVALNDIRTISVLDGSSSVMLGTVAHDGVILIKTK